MTEWIPQLRNPIDPDDPNDADRLVCFRCEKPTQEPSDMFCLHCAIDLGHLPIGDRDPDE